MDSISLGRHETRKKSGCAIIQLKKEGHLPRQWGGRIKGK
jgi:hypothetical protein